MRMKPVIFLPEAIGFQVHLFDVPKQMRIQYVFSVSSIKSFDISILVWLARLYVSIPQKMGQ